MNTSELIEPQKPTLVGTLTNSDILFGRPIPAIDKLKIVSEDEFEDIIREWIAGYCAEKYIKVWRAGGARDKGRDVVAIVDENGTWDNFQSKHYSHSLRPSDIWLELGKMCYYTFVKAYTVPRKYYFVSPQGVGPSLGDLLADPTLLKSSLKKEWDKVCKTGITNKIEIQLSDDLQRHIDGLNFSIFTFLDPQELIEQHKKTNYHAARFGGGLKTREKPVIKSIDESEISLKYVKQLLEAYSDHLKTNVKNIVDLNTYQNLVDHFNRQRECFYWAEALNQFSRDSLPTGNTSFQDLKDEIYHGVIDTCNETHVNGFENVKKTTREATKLNIQGNALLSVSGTQDKIGICHHLANESRLIWVKK